MDDEAVTEDVSGKALVEDAAISTLKV